MPGARATPASILSTRSTCPTRYCGMPRGQRKISTNSGSAAMPITSRSSARTTLVISASSSCAAASMPARPKKLRSSTGPSGARPGNLLELQVVAITGRFSARGTTKPNPVRSCATWSRRKASEAVAVLTYSMDERSAAGSGAIAPLPAADLSSIEYVSTATASLAFRRDQVAHDLTGFGFVVPRAENRPVMATTWSSSKFPGRAPEGPVLLRSFLGRAGIEAAAQLDDDEMTRVVRAELREVMGIAAEPELVEIFRWPRGMPQYRVGHVDLVDRIEAGVSRVPGVELAGLD